MENDKAKIMQIKEFSFCVCLILDFFNKQNNNGDSLQSIDNLRKTLEKRFNMKVVMNFNLNNFKEIVDEINRVIEVEKWNDSFMLYINSPAKSNGFITSECHVVEYHKIYSYISTHSELANKLKLIFFNCVGPGNMIVKTCSKLKIYFQIFLKMIYLQNLTNLITTF